MVEACEPQGEIWLSIELTYY